MAAKELWKMMLTGAPGKKKAEPAVTKSNLAGVEISFWSGLAVVFHEMSAARRRQFCIVLLLMIVGTMAELATIGAVLPFLSALGKQEATLPAARFFEKMGAITASQRLFALTSVFSIIVLVAGGIRLQLAGATQDFGFRLAQDLLVGIQRRLLAQPYTFHVQRNSSSLISALEKTEVLVFEVLQPLMLALTGAFLAIFILAALFYIDPFTAGIAIAVFSCIYMLISTATRQRLAANSRTVAKGYDERLKIIQESLGAIRDVIIDGTQSTYLQLFTTENSNLNRARSNTAFIAAAPRFAIETIGIVAIAAIALAASERRGGLAAALPVLGALALGAQRLLPLLQQIYNGWSMASGHQSVIGETAAFLRLPLPAPKADAPSSRPLPFRNSISFEHVTFSYPGHDAVLTDVHLRIVKGTTVAVVGKTGSGKSTFTDLLMGLIHPTFGRISIDSVPVTESNRERWQRNVAHVPQSIFLADTTIARNIALSVADAPPDMKRVIAAAEKAGVHSFITSLPEGYETRAGERGARLSGGQRQRLGIARALYKDAPVLVLDEATSALDESTEASIMHSISELARAGLTVVIIAHRTSTIARCDVVLAIENKSIFVRAGLRSG